MHRTRRTASVFVFLAISFYANPTPAQLRHPPLRAPAPQIWLPTIPTDALRRPRHVVTLATRDPLRTLERLSELAKLERFAIGSTNTNRGEFEASRKRDDQTERILVWLERDFHDPQRKVAVYLAYAKSTSVMGTVSGERLIGTDPGDNLQGLIDRYVEEGAKK